MDYRKEYEKWLASPVVDEATKEELRALASDEETIHYRFQSYLAFGTGGLRGTMNAGTNAMNVYTVAHLMPRSLPPAASRSISLTPCAPRRFSLLPSGSSAVSPASILPPPTIRKSTTATRPIGRTALSFRSNRPISSLLTSPPPTFSQASSGSISTRRWPRAELKSSGQFSTTPICRMSSPSGSILP